MQLLRVKVHRAEHFLGVDRKAVHDLKFSIRHQPMFPAQGRQDGDIGSHVVGAVGLYKTRAVIMLQKFLKQRKARAAGKQPRLHAGVRFKSGEGVVGEEGRQGLHQLHVRVHINAAHFRHSLQANIVRDKRPALSRVSLTHVLRRGGNVKILLVPLDDLVVRAEFLPAFNALFRQLRLGISAKPAVMNDFWNAHSCSPFRRCFPIFRVRPDTPSSRSVRAAPSSGQ